MWPFIYQSRNNRSVIYSFLRKRGLIIYLAALKKGAIGAAHPYYVINRVYYPPPRDVFAMKSKSENIAFITGTSPYKSYPRFAPNI